LSAGLALSAAAAAAAGSLAEAAVFLSLVARFTGTTTGDDVLALAPVFDLAAESSDKLGGVDD